MGKRDGKKRALVRTGDLHKNVAENIKKKCTKGIGLKGRYFNLKIDGVIEGDTEKESNIVVDADEHQNEGAVSDDDDGDSGAGSDDGDDSTGNYNDDNIGKADKGTEHDDENGSAESNDDQDGDAEEEDDEEESDKSEESTGNKQKAKNDSKTIPPSTKQKASNKQHNNSSPDAKKLRTPTQKLSKFQGTAKTSQQIQQLEDNESSTKKRKKANINDVEDKEVAPAKKQRALDEETKVSVEERKEDRNARSLFLKDLPADMRVESVKKLSSEIINVHMPLIGRKHIRSLYAFIEFEDEDAAERNYKVISGLKINKKKFIVDYCGDKSTENSKTALKVANPVNKRRLVIPNFPLGVTTDEMKQHIPEATSLSLKQRGTKRLLFASFANEAAAKNAFEKTENLVISGKKLTVLYAFERKRPKKGMKPRKHIKPGKLEDKDISK